MTEERVKELIDKELEAFSDEVAEEINKVMGTAIDFNDKSLHLIEKIERKIQDGDIPSSSNTQGVSKSISKDIEKMKETIEELRGVYKIL